MIFYSTLTTSTQKGYGKNIKYPHLLLRVQQRNDTQFIFQDKRPPLSLNTK